MSMPCDGDHHHEMIMSIPHTVCWRYSNTEVKSSENCDLHTNLIFKQHRFLELITPELLKALQMWRLAVPRVSRVVIRLVHTPRPVIRTIRRTETQSRKFSNGNPPRRRTMAQDIKDYTAAEKEGSATSFDTTPIPIASAQTFPRIKTTSLSTKRVVIHDKASRKGLTLVLVAFRSFADAQLHSWRDALNHLPENSSQWYDVTINESFGAQALSGFIQMWQRSRTHASLHDYYVSFNSKAREPLENLLPSTNRMYGYVLLLDRQARVRFRACGLATEEGVQAFLRCARQVLEEDQTEERKKKGVKAT